MLDSVTSYPSPQPSPYGRGGTARFTACGRTDQPAGVRGRGGPGSEPDAAERRQLHRRAAQVEPRHRAEDVQLQALHPAEGEAEIAAEIEPQAGAGGRGAEPAPVVGKVLADGGGGRPAWIRGPPPSRRPRRCSSSGPARPCSRRARRSGSPRSPRGCAGSPPRPPRHRGRPRSRARCRTSARPGRSGPPRSAGPRRCSRSGCRCPRPLPSPRSRHGSPGFRASSPCGPRRPEPVPDGARAARAGGRRWSGRPRASRRARGRRRAGPRCRWAGDRGGRARERRS